MKPDKSLIGLPETDGKLAGQVEGINRGTLGIVALILLSILVALVLTQLPNQYQLAPALLIAAIVVFLIILINPYIGVVLYFLYEFLRPYDFIPALLPLRIAMVIEIVTLISWVLRLAGTNKKIEWDLFFWAFLAWVGLIATSVVTAVNNRLAYNVFQSMLVIFIMLIIAVNVTKSYERLSKLIWILLFIHLYFALRGIFNYDVLHYTAGGEQTSGIVGTGYIADENDFALAMNVMIPFAFFIFIYSRKILSKIASAVLLIILTLAVIVSISRGGWVGFVAAMVYCVIAARKKLFGFGLALAIGLIIAIAAPSTYWKEVRSISDPHEATAESRIRYWEAAVRMFVDHPIIGVGPNNGRIWMPDYIRGYATPATQWGRAFHGTLPQVLAELGILGISIYLFMIFYVLKRLFKIRKIPGDEESDRYRLIASNSIIGAIISYMATATFLSTAYYPQLWTLLTFAMILIHIYKSQSRQQDQTTVIPAVQ